MLAISIVALGWIFWKTIIAPLRLKLDPLTLAVAVDRQTGSTGSLTARVASVLELPDKLDHPSGASVALLRAAAADCHRVLSAVDLPKRLNDRRLTTAVVAGAIVVLIPFFLAVGAPATTSLWARRMLGGSAEPWPQKTYLEVPALDDWGTITVPRGEPYTLRARAKDGSVVPDVVSVRYKVDGGTRVEANMVSFGANDFRLEFPAVSSPMTLSLAGGDDVTREFHIRPADRPKITALTLTARHPTASVDSVFNVLSTDSDLSFLAKTKLTLTFAANTPVATASIKLAGQPAATTAPTTAPAGGTSLGDVVRIDDRTFSVTWIQSASVQMEIDLTSVDANLPSVPTQVGIGLKVDRPPTAKLTFIDVKSRVTNRAKIPFTIKATDDYGVAAVKFVVKTEVPDPANPAILKTSSTETVVFGPVKPATEKDVELKQLLALEPLKLPVGTLVTVTAIATDDCYLGAQSTTSPPITFRVVSAEDLYKEILARQQAERSRFQRQRVESQAIRVVMTDLPTQAAVTAVAARHRTVEHEVDHVLTTLTELLAEMRANGLGTDETYSTMQTSVLDPLRKLKDDPIRKQREALEKLHAGDMVAMDDVRAREDNIIDGMADVLKKMNQWDSLVSVLNQLDEVIKVQTQARDGALELKKKEEGDIFNK
jgi:hypothetical protein